MRSGKPYQGFPYVNPIVTEAPRLSPSQVAALSRWRDLPTRKITTQPLDQRPRDQRKNEDLPKVYIDPKTAGSKDNLYPHYATKKRRPKHNEPEHEPEPEIYIDLPEESFSGSSVSEGANSTSGINNTNRFNNTNDANSGSGVSAIGVNNTNDGSGGTTSTNGGNTSDWVLIGVNGNKRENVKSRKEGTSSVYEDNNEIEPVVYIDIPETDESNVSQRLAATESEPDYAEQTIYYNPFKENKIEAREDDATSSQPWPSQQHLDVTSPCSSAANLNLPPFLSKEAYIYGRQPTPDDDFSLSPIPLDEYHQPPPSYEEAARTISPQGPGIRPDPKPPRTQVIIRNTENHVVGQADLERQLLYCQHCNKQVNTLVVRETGALTHVVAWLFMLMCLFPVTIGIYFLDTFKYRNHYCPNCNKKIGYEVPYLCKEMQYVYED